LESLVGQLARSLASRVVYGFEDVFVQPLSSFALERKAQHEKGVCKTLNSKSDWTVAHVGVAGLNDWIIVAIDNFVEIPGCYLCRFIKPLEIVAALFHISITFTPNKGWKCSGCQVAHS
jgi:hypothetical protein